MKRCRKCRLDKPLDAFPPHKATRCTKSRRFWTQTDPLPNRVKWKTPLLAFLLTRTTDLHRDTR